MVQSDFLIQSNMIDVMTSLTQPVVWPWIRGVAIVLEKIKYFLRSYHDLDVLKVP
jgi:hypothetical protein